MSDSEINDEDEYIENEGENANEAVDEEDVATEENIEEEKDEEKEIRNEEAPQIVVERTAEDPTASTYIFHDEDHTLGNALRFILVKRPDVEFCGYSIPHPSENFMNMRLQTIQRGSDDVLSEGLKDLSSLCDVIDNKFDEALTRFQKKKIK